jgi:hypothetical protein
VSRARLPFDLGFTECHKRADPMHS